MPWEFNILDYLSTFHNNDILNNIMIFISSINNNGYVWITITALLFLSKKYRIVGITCALALIFMEISGNFVLKPIINRPRPYEVNFVELLIPTPNGSSFPSGHTYSSFAAATAIFMWKKDWGIAAFVLAFLIGFSRMYLYVHYPTDVMAAVLLGVIDGVIMYLICKKLKFKMKNI